MTTAAVVSLTVVPNKNTLEKQITKRFPFAKCTFVHINNDQICLFLSDVKDTSVVSFLHQIWLSVTLAISIYLHASDIIK